MHQHARSIEMEKLQPQIGRNFTANSKWMPQISYNLWQILTDTPWEALSQRSIFTCGDSYAGQGPLFVVFSPQSHFFTNKDVVKLGHIVNWDHQFHQQTQF